MLRPLDRPLTIRKPHALRAQSRSRERLGALRAPRTSSLVTYMNVRSERFRYTSARLFLELGCSVPSGAPTQHPAPYWNRPNQLIASYEDRYGAPLLSEFVR